MEIRAHEQIAREVIDGLTDDILGYVNPTNDNCLAPWMMALERAKEAVVAIQAVCDAISARPAMNPGQMALRAIAALPESDVSSPEEEEVFTAYEAEARRVAEVREAARIDAAHPAVLNMSDFAASVCGMKKVV